MFSSIDFPLKRNGVSMTGVTLYICTSVAINYELKHFNLLN